MTLLSALWKAGKTTLLAHLLKALEEEGEFCGRPVLASRVLYVTEEHESKWAERRDELGLTDHIDFIIRPFHQKPTMPEWLVFLRDLRTSVQARPVDLLVFDVLSNLWPVRDENDATQVQAALMPLHVVAEDVALLLVHHLRKGDGKEATGSRGSGALTAFVDTIIELRRFEAAARKDRRRVLTGYGRYDETPEELVVELTEARRERYGTVFRTIEPARYVALGDHAAIRARQFEDRLLAAMPRSAPGLTSGQILEVLQQEHGTAVRRASLVEALDAWAEEGRVVCEGEGVRNDPYRYWTPPPDDHAVPAEAHSSAEGALLAALACLRAATAAQLADIAGLPLPEVEAALSALEARGEVLAVLSRENGRVYRDVGSLPEDES